MTLSKRIKKDLRTKLVATVSKLGYLKLIVQDKEKELLSKREKKKKVEDEVSILKGTVESLSSRMKDTER